MSKKFVDKNQWVSVKRSQDRLHVVRKQHLIDHAKVKPNPTHAKRLVTLRYRTVEQTLASLKNENKSFQFHKTHPMSNVPNFQAIRHDYREKSRLILESEQGEHNVNPDVFPQTPVRRHPKNPKVFISGGGRLYKKSESHIELAGEVKANLLQQVSDDQINVDEPVRAASQNENSQSQIETVTLSYKNLKRPAGRFLPLNNNRSQGGFSANDLAQIQQDEFIRGLVELGLATEEEATQFTAYSQSISYEHTHKFASHFGILKTPAQQLIDPRAPKSTFVAPAALNTEMMLFEKFADFLLFKNRHSNGFYYDQPSVEYACELRYVPGTSQVAALKLQVKDLHTGKTFAQVWNEPYKVIDKPAAARYTALLKLLKASVEDRPILGSPLRNKN